MGIWWIEKNKKGDKKMKKIVFGAILSAFLLVSVQFVAPINVKAVETQKDQILKEMSDLTDILVEDQDFIDIINDNELLDIIEGILEAETKEEIEDLVFQFKDKVEEKFPNVLERLGEETKAIENRVTSPRHK